MSLTNSLRGCIGLGFHKILKDFFMIKKSYGIQLRFLQNKKKYCGI
jgi:hypothetical protein